MRRRDHGEPPDVHHQRGDPDELSLSQSPSTNNTEVADPDPEGASAGAIIVGNMEDLEPRGSARSSVFMTRPAGGMSCVVCLELTL